MMISPEGYYEFELKGKSEAEIMKEIRSLKRTIGKLKTTMEHPDYVSIIDPSEDVQLWCTRMYLERAIQALEEVGGTYTPTKAELKSTAFDNNIDFIHKITFEIDGFCQGMNRYVFDFAEDKAKCFVSDWLAEPEEKPMDMDKEELLSGIRELHIGEWRRHYTLKRFGYMVIDGTQWEFKIEYSNGAKPECYDGDNAYPYNFSKFLELFGLENEIDYDEDEDE